MYIGGFFMKIQFESKIQQIQQHVLVLLPKEISQKLPSRGMLMGRISFLDLDITVPLEPDGNQSHWFEIDPLNLSSTQLAPDCLIPFTLELLDDWEEPIIPRDLMDALTYHHLVDTWDCLSVKARWDWIRWIQFTKNPDTRNKRIQVTCSKLNKGEKRPCCFDRSRCTITAVSKSGKLIFS